MSRTLYTAVLLFAVGSASATTITIQSGSSIADAVAKQDAWILANMGTNWNAQIMEGFEGYTANNQSGYTSLNTAVGTFSLAPGSQPGDPLRSNGNKANQFTILDASDTPFSGRYNTTPGGQNWLDSNDITALQLTTSLDMLVFLITDVNDCAGVLTIQTADGTTSSAFAQYPTAKDGNIYSVIITSSSPIGTVRWLNNSNDDGFGLDAFGTIVDPPPPGTPTAPTPEPASVAVSGLGLAAIAAFRKFRAARS